jgi:hypothetical protein
VGRDSHAAYHKLVILLICAHCIMCHANNNLQLCKGGHMHVGTHHHSGNVHLDVCQQPLDMLELIHYPQTQRQYSTLPTCLDIPSHAEFLNA